MGGLLKKVYYDYMHPASFGGIARLATATKVPYKDVKNWLIEQDVYSLHKPVRQNYRRRSTLAFGQNELWQADIVDMKKYAKENNGIKYLLTVIDVFTRFAYALPLKYKNAHSVLLAFKSLFKQQIPINLQTDKGKEFYNRIVEKLFKSNQVNHYSTNSETKASVVERFNRTLKSKMYRVFTYRNSYKYIDVLKKLIQSYNNSVHRSIGIAPAQYKANLRETVFNRLYGYSKKSNFKLKPGDQVRISKHKSNFRKGYLPGWSYEVFIVDKRYPTSPPTYVVKDLKGERIKGRFYTEELQKVKKSKQDFWLVENILKTRRRGKRIQHFVKWKGFDDRFNSWINASWMK